MHATLDEFLDRRRTGLASTYLTRLKVGPRLVDAAAVPRLYDGAVRPRHLLALAVAGLLALGAAIGVTPVGQEWADALVDGRRTHHHRPDRQPARTLPLMTFRQHLTTLVAVFVALAVGIVLGGGLLSDVTEAASTEASAPAEEAAPQAAYTESFTGAVAPGARGRPARRPRRSPW